MRTTERKHCVHSSRTYTATRRLLATALRPLFTITVALLLMGVVTGSRAGIAEPAARTAQEAVLQFVKSVQADEGKGRLEVRVATTSQKAPGFAVFPLREPDRLVFDLPSFQWEPGLTAHLETSYPGIKEVRAGQFSDDPPVTRLVFELTTPVEKVRYRTITSGSIGDLRIRLADEVEAHTILTETHRPQTTLTAPTVRRPIAKPAPSIPVTAAPTAAPDEPAASAPTGPATPAASPPLVPAAMEDPDPIPAVAQAPAPVLTRPELGAREPAPAPVTTASSSSWRGNLLRFLGAALVLAVVGVLAFWLRRRFHSATSEGAIVGGAAERTSPTFSPSQLASSLDVIRCRIVDGYLVLAPEGGLAALGKLAGTPHSARVEGSVEVTSVQIQAAAAEEPLRTPEPEAAPEPAADTRLPGSPAETAKKLVAALSDADVTVRKAAAQGLWTLADGGRTDILLPYLESDDPRVRLVTAGVLGEAGATQCADALAKLLSDRDPSVRASAVYAFSQLGAAASKHSDAVRTLLSDREDLVRARAVEALAALNPQSGDAAAEIMGMTSDLDPAVRQAAADSSLAYVERGVTQAMIDLLGEVTQRAKALELLQRAEDSALRRLLFAARQAADRGNSGPLDTLSYVVSARWTPEDLVEDLQSPEEAVRLAALEGLAVIGGDDAMMHVVRLAKTDPSHEVKRRAAEILDASHGLAAQTAGSHSDAV